MAFDTIIRSGTVATAADTFACDVGISGETITALGTNLGDAREIDHGEMPRNVIGHDLKIEVDLGKVPHPGEHEEDRHDPQADSLEHLP